MHVTFQLILDLGSIRLPVPQACQQRWMSQHVTRRIPNAQWFHQQVATVPGTLRYRTEASIYQIDGQGGRAHLDTSCKILHTQCDDGFWVTHCLRFFDMQSRLQDDQLATHASVIRKHNKVWVLAGVSTAGKSTASSLAESVGWQKLQDDLAFLKEGYYLDSIDWNHLERPRQHKKFKVNGIVLLEKSKVHQLIPITYLEAIKRLGPIWGFPKIQDPQRWLDIFDREMRAIPAYRLKFRKDAGFARLLESQ